MDGPLPSRATRVCTLLLLLDGAGDAARVLLGRKRRGFGAGRLNGFGGKVEPGETLLSGALREMHEESGVVVAAADTAHVGHLVFTFAATPGEELHVHVFSAHAHSGTPVETDEMTPMWTQLRDGMPYDSMWADDRFWFPLLLQGQRFRGVFAFDGHDTIAHHELVVVAPSERVCSYVADAATAVIFPAGSQQQPSLPPSYGIIAAAP